jgi:uncharacterized protein YdiU (UPF0061 family)
LAGHADGGLIDDLMAPLQAHRVDFTSCFRALASSLRGDSTCARALFSDPSAYDEWSDRWRTQLGCKAPHLVAEAMDKVNPVYIPRNHLVEEALAAASTGDLQPFQDLLEALARPFDERPGLDPYAAPSQPGLGTYRTFCGT